MNIQEFFSLPLSFSSLPHPFSPHHTTPYLTSPHYTSPHTSTTVPHPPHHTTAALTHFSARYSGDEAEDCASIMRNIEQLAREASWLRGEADVVAAWDGATLTVPTRATAEQGRQ